MTRCIRWMIRRDLPRVLEIENSSYEFPWNENQFLTTLRQSDCLGIVIEGRSGRLIGFAIYELQRRGLEIIDLAVDLDQRRTGAATAMIDYLKQKMIRQNRQQISMLVSEESLSAQLFLKSQGFRATEVLPAYYDEDNCDAYVMRHFRQPLIPGFFPINRLSRYMQTGT